jgi:peptidoglycan/xylan/chitin deacetylase (PgdA/CDA1 family)
LYTKPVLDEFGFKATFAIPTAAISGGAIIVPTENSSTATNPDMSWAQLQVSYNDGMEIASHIRYPMYI